MFSSQGKTLLSIHQQLSSHKKVLIRGENVRESHKEQNVENPNQRQSRGLETGRFIANTSKFLEMSPIFFKTQDALKAPTYTTGLIAVPEKAFHGV